MRRVIQIYPPFHHGPAPAPTGANCPPAVSLIDLIGSPCFFDDLAHALSSGFGFGNFHIFLYRTHQAPVNLTTWPSLCDYQRGLDNYLNYTYVINPVFRGFLGDTPSGVYLISDFVPSDFKHVIDAAEVEIRVEATEPIGYRTPGWPKNKAECIVLIRLPNGTALDLSFLTHSDSRSVARCKAQLTALFPVLDRVIQKQFQIDPACFDCQPQRPGQEDRFQDFGQDVLTDREVQVVQLILVGHSSTSIALHFDVSLSTIKTHRKNIYSKLQISSQAELFNLFLLHLK